MQIAMVGLGKMGANMVRRLLHGGHGVVAFDLNEAAIQAVETEGAIGARMLKEVISKLSTPRAVWIMVPAGDPTESTIDSLADHMESGDILIDGGNSNYKDTIRRVSLTG